MLVTSGFIAPFQHVDNEKVDTALQAGIFGEGAKNSWAQDRFGVKEVEDGLMEVLSQY